MITTVLSRAAAEDRMAAAYLLSGTRGVGKTTIARILAKALNCVNAPTAEPCNQCANCQMITKGNHVDVTEIDGASNNSVEDARALRENIGYAPMEGRYKVFIIDEAHMLSRSAFNALLKTLEEPPPRVVFIFATTEVHKFPITIVSRCQHFIFKRVSEDGLVAHLSRVLTKENVSFDPQAVRTIARRANGSVRDSMSLLGQTLALGESSLSMEGTRAVLGLAGQELFITLMEAIAQENCPAVIDLMQKLCDQGIDIGFFLRELINLWRTLFLLREAGQAIIPSLGLGEEDSQLWQSLATKFSAAHLHAAWHMTLDAQRKVIHSPEPAAALELLLINLTLMPRLLPLQAAPAPEHRAHSGPIEAEKKNSPNLEEPTQRNAYAQKYGELARSAPQQTQAPKITPPWEKAEEAKEAPQPLSQVEKVSVQASLSPEPSMSSTPAAAQSVQTNMAQASTMEAKNSSPESILSENSSFEDGPPDYFAQDTPPMDAGYANDNFEDFSASQAMNDLSAPAQPSSRDAQSARQPSWEEIVAFNASQEPPLVADIFFRQVTGTFQDGQLHIYTKSMTAYAAVDRAQAALQQALQGLCQYAVQLQVHKPEKSFKPEVTLVQEFSARADLKDCLEILDASIYKVRPLNDT